jgi:hypothetical protein
MLDEVAVFYDAESEVRLEQLTTTLEPAILIVMGGVVVTILLAFTFRSFSRFRGGASITAVAVRDEAFMKECVRKRNLFYQQTAG